MEPAFRREVPACQSLVFGRRWGTLGPSKTLLYAPLALVLGFAACSTRTVRLYEFREADPGTPRQQAYLRLTEAVDLANEFLHESRYARVFPAERASFSLGMTDIIVQYEGEGYEPVRIEETGFGDLRTALSHNSYPTKDGFLSYPVTGPEARNGEGVTFFQQGSVDMAALLLRQATISKEMNTRSPRSFWLNYSILGAWPENGWGGSNPVLRRAYAVEYAFRKWLGEREKGRKKKGPLDKVSLKS